MLLKRLSQLWVKPSNDGISATIARRTVLVLWLCATVCYLAISPFIVSEQLLQTIKTIGLYGEMLSEELHSQEKVHELSLKSTEKYGIEGLYRKDNTADQVGHFVMFSNDLLLDNISVKYNLKNAAWWSRVPEAMSIVFGDGNSVIRIMGYENDAVPRVDVFIKKDFLQDRIGGMFTNAALIGFAMFIVTHFAVWFTVRAYIGASLSAMLASLYATPANSPLMDKKNSPLVKKLNENHSALEVHIYEQARLASLGAAAGRLAHDIRNLLASLLLISERFVAMEGEAESKLGKRMQASVNRALALCDWASRYTSAKRDQIVVSELSLAPLVDEVLSFVALHDPRSRVELINGVSTDFTVLAERTLLFRILFNIGLNAVQAMQRQQDRGFLRITARLVDKNVEIDLIDGGPGLDASDALSSIEPHNNQPKGTGLGMTIAADLARWHGGELELVRSDSFGTCFRLNLPLMARQREDSIELADFVISELG